MDVTNCERQVGAWKCITMSSSCTSRRNTIVDLSCGTECLVGENVPKIVGRLIADQDMAELKKRAICQTS